MAEKAEIKQVNIITESDCGQYVYVTKPGIDGFVQVKFDDEGVVVDIFSKNEASIASTYSTYIEMED